jgi:hypothetical protein
MIRAGIAAKLRKHQLNSPGSIRAVHYDDADDGMEEKMTELILTTVTVLSLGLTFAVAQRFNTTTPLRSRNRRH